MQNDTQNLQDCLQESDQKRGDVCKDCLKSFDQLKNQYNQLHRNPNGICFEVVDQVDNLQNNGKSQNK